MWQELTSNGWLVAGVLLVLLIFRDVVTGWLSRAFHAVDEAVYRGLAGTWLVRGRALKRYRRSVASAYAEVSVPFLEARLPMRDIYVPVAALSLTGGQADDHLRTVVTGGPGAGKSMLLRHAMLTWATSDSAGLTTPVLCDLHRHNGTELSLEDHLGQQLGRHGFPGASKFIERSLRDGHLTVLLDGFDEVSTSERERVGKLVSHFAARYPDTRMVMTCRTATYNPQLIPEMTQLLEVGELDDRKVRDFAARWPEIKGTQRVQHFLESLRESPNILRLARNPLLLTMITRLHADAGGGRQLPQSRAQIYDQTTGRLGGVKTEILQKIALAGMDATGGADWVSIPHRAVIDLAEKALPSLNESPRYAEQIIDEIVAQGGLEKGARYRFAHVGLQEFLAARELAGDPAGLMERFEADPSRWRESVKLWCGITGKDCTEVILAVYQLDPLVGLECLAEARVADAELTDRIVAEMLARDNVEPPVVAAFAAIAADPSRRGAATYDRLVSLAGSRQEGAIQALAATDLPKAAQLLSQLAETRAEVRPALVRLGELAVPTLTGQAKAGEQWAVDHLAAIATPRAIDALVQLLWAGPSSLLASRAAWRLAALTAQPDIAGALRAAAPPSVRLGGYDWCWEPFAGPGQGSLPYVMAQICLLLDQAEAAQTRPDDLGDIDPRIGVPLCLREFERTAGSNAELKIFRDGMGEDIPARDFSLLARAWEQELTDHPKPVGLKALVLALPSALRPVVVALAAENTHFSRKDWARITDGSPYRFSASPSYRLLFGAICAALLSGFALGLGRVTGWWPAWGPAWLGWLAIVLTAGAAWSAAMLDMARKAGNLREGVSGLLKLGSSAAKRRVSRSDLALGVFGAALALSVLLVVANGQRYAGWPTALSVAAVLILGAAGIWRMGHRKESHTYSAMRELIPFMR